MPTGSCPHGQVTPGSRVCPTYAVGERVLRQARAGRNEPAYPPVVTPQRLARHTRPDSVHREPPGRVAAPLAPVDRAHDPLDPHVVGRQLGELVLELFEVQRAGYRDPDA